jgi:hypothetical protein
VVKVKENGECETILVLGSDNGGAALLAIHLSFQDLIDSCRSAYAVNDRLDKDRTVHNDSFDSLLLNLSWYKWN